DIPGGTLLEYWQGRPDDAARVTSELGETLRAIHAHRGSRIGKIAYTDKQAPKDVRCEGLVLDRALGHLDHAAERIGRLGDERERLEEALHSLASGIERRSEY